MAPKRCCLALGVGVFTLLVASQAIDGAFLAPPPSTARTRCIAAPPPESSPPSAAHDSLSGTERNRGGGSVRLGRAGGAAPRLRVRPPASTVIAVDVENCRGASAFRLGHEALLSRAAAWRSEQQRGGGAADGSEPALALVVDHGSVRQSHSGGPLPDRIGVLFAGPALTADDVIVSIVGERCGGGGGADSDGGDPSGPSRRNATVVVTADAGLIARCQRRRREARESADVSFVEPVSFLSALEAHADVDGDLFEARAAAATASSVVVRDGVDVVNGDDALGGAANGDREHIDDEEDDGGTDAIDAFLDKTAVERTVEMRQRLLRDYNAKIGPPVRGGKAGGDRRRGAISRRQRNKLLARRHHARKKKELADAAGERRASAERLRLRLTAAGTSHTTSAPITRLLGWLSSPPPHRPESAADGPAGSTASGQLLRWSAGADGGADPLASVLRVRTRRSGGRRPASPPPVRPLRVVVISDTHGFEGALSRLPAPEGSRGGDASGEEDDRHERPWRLPDADVLIHCGDFAASGSRMRKRVSVRKLDEFLAAQRHIAEKIVVRGNHDPETPAGVLFPRSRALYATSSARLNVNGVSFALEPYSRRYAARHPRQVRPLQKCDVLVSHEPPHGVLDLTYSGTRAGSAVLRRAVEMSQAKPRVWLCGHIHEGRGAARWRFVDEAEGDGGSDGDNAAAAATTLVVNAANANPGKASRLVAGAVVVDVDRDPAFVGSDEDADGEAPRDERERLINGDGVSDVRDLGLEPAQLRPGVRRRRRGLDAARRRAGRHG